MLLSFVYYTRHKTLRRCATHQTHAHIQTPTPPTHAHHYVQNLSHSIDTQLGRLRCDIITLYNWRKRTAQPPYSSSFLLENVGMVLYSRPSFLRSQFQYYSLQSTNIHRKKNGNMMITNTTGHRNYFGLKRKVTVQRGLCKKFHVKAILLWQCGNNGTSHNIMAVHWSDRKKRDHCTRQGWRRLGERGAYWKRVYEK